MGMNSKKVVLKLDLHDDKDKQKAMKVVSKISFLDSIAIDMKEMKLTVVGDVDPVNVVSKLRKYWNTDIFSVGPAKEPEKKKDDANKDNNQKKDDGKKGGGGGGDKKKETGDQIPAYNPYLVPYYSPHIVTYNPQMNYPQHYTTHYPPMDSPYNYVQHEENPNGCVIC